ncbi:DMT family transporter [Paralimibaculum aggregatum]|uniref:DMT family transporter n=1 Tax=Paralimibaculum aggregatum TaxID=3036245 RepID=A0ABQ6LKP8_9RHOB|nr:DMT family transporter [Limibaculum sp. NKW23]GMG80860.1 DMT family transporter [Limibaculum sp. NKW23]
MSAPGLETHAAADRSGEIRAALWMTGAIASFSLMAVAGRELAGHLDTFEIMTYRSLIGLVVVLGLGAATGRLRDIRTRRLPAHLCRNLFHFAGQNLWFYAVGVIPLAQVFALEFTTPIWVALLAPFVLAERLTRTRLIAAGLGFLGILLVARPGLTPVGPGHLAAALAAVCFCGNVLATKSLSGTDRVWTILFWMTLMQAAMGLACALVDGTMTLPDATSLPFVVAVGICGLTAHLCVTSALAAAPALIVAPMDFLRLPLIALVGMALYDEPLEIAVFAGAGLILAGNLMNLRSGGRR